MTKTHRKPKILQREEGREKERERKRKGERKGSSCPAGAVCFGLGQTCEETSRAVSLESGLSFYWFGTRFSWRKVEKSCLLTSIVLTK